jgi:acyl carrier protein
MAASAGDRDHRRWRDQGMGSIAPDEGVALLDQLLQAPPAGAQVAILPIDWTTLLRRYSAGQEPRLFAEIAASLSQVRRAAPPVARRRSLAEELTTIAPGRQRAFVDARLRDEAVKVLGLAPDTPLDASQPLRELGLDSLMAVELRNAIADALGRTLPSTLLFKYPTLEALSEFAATQLVAAATPAAAPAGTSDAAEVAALTDDEARDLLSSELQSLAGLWSDGSTV